MPRFEFYTIPNQIRRSFQRRKLLKSFGGDVDLFVEEYSKPKVLSLYREWIRQLNKTLPLAVREVSKQTLRAHFEATKDDFSPYLILNELEAGKYALDLWKEGDRHALKYGIPRNFSTYLADREKRPPDSITYKRYTPFLYSL